MSKRFDRRRRGGATAGSGRGMDSGETGVDPALFFTPIHESGRGDRKVQQICKEVERTLGYALGSCGDPLLGELTVMAVEPAPDASRLLVSLYASRAGLDARELIERLDKVKARFREEVAAVLQRKRTPELSFRLAAPEEQGAGVQDEPEGAGE